MARVEMEHEELDSFVPGETGLEAESAVAEAVADGESEPKQAREAKAPKESAKDTAALNRRIAELEASERYWADKAKSGSPGPEQKKAAEPDELDSLLAGGEIDGDTAAGLLDELGEKGVAALQKRGLVTKTQLKQILSAVEKRMEARAAALTDGKIAGARGEISAEAKMIKDFPELADDKSAFSVATAREFAELVAENPTMNNYSALRMAAKVVRAQTGGGGLSERMARIAAQSPGRGSRSAGVSEFDDGEIDLDADARSLIAQGAKYGLTDDIYKKNSRRAS